VDVRRSRCLLATVRGGRYEAGGGAVLPCYLIYWEIGKELRRHGSPDPRYQRWIDAYGAAGHGEVVSAVIAEADVVAQSLSDDERAPDAQALPYHKPVRVDVLGHGIPPGILACLSSASWAGHSQTACGPMRLHAIARIGHPG
jgi:hypothetical protein